MIHMIPVYIGLGSNQGQSEANLARAREQITSMTGVVADATSQVYYTEPQGVKDQPWFANQVLKILCHPTWTPETFMRHLLLIEEILGRKRLIRWGPRRIDCDLLLFGQETVDTPDLTLPHPRMTERAFVLIPLLEITPQLCFPSGARVGDYLPLIRHRIQGRHIWQEESSDPEMNLETKGRIEHGMAL